MLEANHQFTLAWETPAFKRIAAMDLVLDMAGGTVAVMARKLR